MAWEEDGSPARTPSVTDAALDAMEADELRTTLRKLMPYLDGMTHATLVTDLIDRSARNSSDWIPQGPTAEDVASILSFVKSSRRASSADPTEVDHCLQQGSNAFLSRDYKAARQIFHSLLVPIANADIDLGQEEMIEEVLGTDPETCTIQYVVSIYMTTPSQNRGRAVLSAFDETAGIVPPGNPLQWMERVAVEPLPNFETFVSQWRTLVEDRAECSWLHEVVRRMEGVDGIAKLAITTRRPDDLRAWCRPLLESRDWTAALSAHLKAAELVTDTGFARSSFLDGAALAAQELRRTELSEHLENAWRACATMVRLRRWLGTSKTKTDLLQRAATALSACPKEAHRQRALLHLLEGDLLSAADLLANAPGLSWSNQDHPGHLLFPFFCHLLGDVRLRDEDVYDHDEYNLMYDREEPCLSTPEISELMELAGRTGQSVSPIDDRTRAVLFAAMRSAAESRIADVAGDQHRHRYGHAVSLIAACVAVDGTEETAAWMAGVRREYVRFSALQREFRRVGG